MLFVRRRSNEQEVASTVEPFTNFLDELLPNKKGIEYIFGIGANHPTSDKDITIIVKDEQPKRSILEKILKNVGEIRKYNATFYVATEEEYRRFDVDLIHVGQDGIGSDYGWGRLATRIRMSYLANTAECYYDSGNFKLFLNEIKNKLSRTEIPLNEPYELYKTTLWDSFISYIISGEDSKLAKSVLRLFYSLLAIDDGKFRNSYDEIAKDAHLVNLGMLIHQLEDRYNFKFDDEKLVAVKKGNIKFNDKERRAYEIFFSDYGNLMELYASSMGFLNYSVIRDKLSYFVTNKIKVFGGVDKLVATFDKLILDKKYNFVVLYLDDLLPYLDINKKNHKAFLEKMLSGYDAMFKFGKEMGSSVSVLHLRNYIKIKHLLGKLDLDEINEKINYLNEVLRDELNKIYVARGGIDKGKQFVRTIISDLYYYKSKYTKLDESELEEMLLYDPINQNKLEVFVRHYSPEHEFVSFEVARGRDLVGQKYRELLKKFVEYRIDTEIQYLYDFLDKRKFEGSSSLIQIYLSRNTNTFMHKVDEIESYLNYKKKMFFDYIDSLVGSRELKFADSVISLVLNVEETVYRALLAIQEGFGFEHDLLLKYHEVRKNGV